ncbi:sensor histidine kinase [Microcoleus sp. FACHB-SPT15]|uniref:sensor histidine kinase n=1 Tax=Microcoleus sp. FACHB-SPT15 TaxID=2692830 RepID=UPI00177DB06D|nr:sensor histidine kinase [Microcoleus sp. FACHB-SPT15]MBD1808422.1 sensor histidine kinase [Microcoleus sp. FACHB-SPT15]
MLNASQVIADQTDTIMAQWIEVVRQERQIESSLNMSDTALGDSLPILLKTLAAVLQHPQKNLFERIAEVSLEHGTLRAGQGYDAAEIAKEYGLLRRMIFSVLEEECLQGSPQEIIQLFSQINTLLDEAISICFKSYMEARLHELEQLQSQLTLTNQELTRLIEASKDNLSYLAHELKTPLTAVIGYSELLLRLQKQNANADMASPSLQSIERVLQGGRHLLRIVNDSLELSRYESAQIQLNLEWIDVCSLITRVSEMLEPLAQAENLQLKLDYDRAPSKILTDSFRLQQVLTNLVGNAIRYTDVGFIQIRCESLPDDKCFFAVTDTGIGIDPSDCDRIFEPFSQAFLNQGQRKQEGTGLGLAIVSRLVKLLHGEIDLVSEVGVGSTFTVTLPIKIQVEQTDQ